MKYYQQLEKQMDTLRNQQIAATRFEKFWVAYEQGLVIYGLVFGGMGYWLSKSFLFHNEKIVILLIFANLPICIILSILLGGILMLVGLIYGKNGARIACGLIPLIYKVNFIKKEIMTYISSITIIILCYQALRLRLGGNRDHFVSFLILSVLLYGFHFFKDFCRLYFVQSLISNHIFKLEAANYILEDAWLVEIREEVDRARKDQFENQQQVNINALESNVFEDSSDDDLNADKSSLGDIEMSPQMRNLLENQDVELKLHPALIKNK